MKPSVAKVSKTIFIGKEAHLFLSREQRKQRGCKPLPDEVEEKAWNRMYKNKNGMKMVDDNSYGGGDGTYRGKWWGWNVDTIKAMLNEANLPYIEGEPIEYFEVYL